MIIDTYECSWTEMFRMHLSTMNPYSVHFLDLPDEILLHILQKLDNVDVLYSLFGINNQRLQCLCEEKHFCSTLDFLSVTSTITNLDLIFDRFCNYILPRIHHLVRCFIVKSAHMERILSATSYPNLTELKVKFQRDQSLHPFSDNSPLRNSLKQIKKMDLIVDDHDKTILFWRKYTKEVYAHILTWCENLEQLTMKYSQEPYAMFSLGNLLSNTFSSSSLTSLNVNIVDFDDCLCLLDGRLKKLQTCIVQVSRMGEEFSNAQNLDDLPNVKCFSFVYYGPIKDHDDRVQSLVRRMFNLEKLTLYLSFDPRHVFLDPVSLLNHFATSSSQLHSFSFCLHTVNNPYVVIPRHLSMNNIQRNLLNVGQHQVFNFADFLPNRIVHQIFTVPFEFSKIYYMNKILSNIVFKNVIDLWLYDIFPFKHGYVLIISENFPLLEKFYICNLRAALSETNKASTNKNQSSRIAIYTHLKRLDVTTADPDCIELFLDESKTRLPCLNHLRIVYDRLQIVTRDFTREETRRNCMNVNLLYTERETIESKECYAYFPLL